MTTSAISVVVPTYNRSWGLRRAVESVLMQTFTDFELLIVDDASTDDTERVAQSFTDPRVRYIRQPVNRGIGRNWAEGVRNCTSRYVCFLMDDDYYLTDRFLADRVAALDRHPECVMAFGGYTRVDPDGRLLTTSGGDFPDGRVFDALSTVREVYYPHKTFIGCIMYRREAVMALLPVIERYDLAIDYALHMHILSPEYGAVYCRPVSFAWAVHDQQVSNTRRREAVVTAIRIHQELQRNRLPRAVERAIRRITPDWWLSLANIDRTTNRWAAAGHVARSVSGAPWSLGLWRSRAAYLRRLLTRS